MSPATHAGDSESPRVASASSLDGSSTPPPGVPRALSVAFALLMLALLAGGLVFHQVLRRRLRATAESELEIIGRLKVDQIAEWRRERLGDAFLLTENRYLRDAIAAYLSAPQPRVDAGMQSLFESLQRYYGYDDVALADAAGQVRWSLSGSTSGLQEQAATDIALAFATHRPLLSDLHSGPGTLPPHVDVIAPILAGDKRPGDCCHRPAHEGRHVPLPAADDVADAEHECRDSAGPPRQE